MDSKPAVEDPYGVPAGPDGAHGKGLGASVSMTGLKLKLKLNRQASGATLNTSVKPPAQGLNRVPSQGTTQSKARPPSGFTTGMRAPSGIL